MSSAQSLREFINQRLTAAAEEIFTVVEHTIAQYEEEIARQHRLFEITWKPEVKLHRTELPQHNNHSEKQVIELETNDCPEQREPELRQIKEEQEEPGLPPFQEELEEFDSSQEREQLILKFEGDAFRIPSFEEAEEERDTEQVLAHDSEVHHVKTHNNSGSTITSDLNDVITSDIDHVDDVSASAEQAECETLFSQGTCGKIVRKKHVLRPNLKSIADERKFCEYCGTGFTRQSDLLVHLRCHTGEKPHSCQTCGKGFARRSHLIQHIRTHTGEKPYSCQTCGKSFSQQSSVLRHMKTHTGPHFCETCGTCFGSQSDLLCHMSTHTELFDAAEDEYSLM